ncbi:DUF2059 domain-containing protein [Quatrionicoccus australiensis]|uniref:DUF2059 domain-containing protein n=1 Tax=Quatrionicoccus australiensis TaxID=138118 RepID=UPI001CFAD213|nr:DUF2059 domain-containing protein [Quatrionicoccus australiensis]MCB4359682.1 DUF2059 domain-containing protein [Quatrionicoccus australiensis]
MKKLVLSFMLLVYGVIVFAQTQDDAAIAANAITEHSWKTTESSMPFVIANMENVIRNNGATENAAKALSAEVSKAFSRESITRILAENLRSELTVEELRELSAFVESSAGKKYLRINFETEATQKMLKPIMREACKAVNQQLGFFDRGSLHKICRDF